MAVGRKETPYSTRGRSIKPYKPEEPDINWMQIMNTGMQGANMFNKIRETNLLETGYLTDTRFGFTPEGADTLHSMFVRNPGERGIIGGVKNPFRSVTDRIKLNPTYETELFNLSEVSGNTQYEVFSEQMLEQGMPASDIEALGSGLDGYGKATPTPNVTAQAQTGPFTSPELSQSLDKFNLGGTDTTLVGDLGPMQGPTPLSPQVPFFSPGGLGSIAGVGNIPAWNPMAAFNATATTGLNPGVQSAIQAFGNPVTGAMPANTLVQNQMSQILGGLGSTAAPTVAPAMTATLAEPGFFSKLFGGGAGAGAGAGGGLLGGLGAALGPIGWAFMAMQLLGGLKNLFRSDRRLKENIVQVGKSSSGINIYEFNFKGNEDKYKGVMSDEVPWAVLKDNDDYDIVDYNQIDVTFEKIS